MGISLKTIGKIGGAVYGGITGGPVGAVKGYAIGGTIGGAGDSLVGGGANSASNVNNQLTEEQLIAIATAQDIINEGYDELFSKLESGSKEDVGQILELRKTAVAEIFDQVELGANEIHQFAMWADARLEPYAKQGVFAGDELASMLGIRNSRGEKVPFDPSIIERTPGYEWLQGEMQKATSRQAAARGTLLSGRTMIEINDRANEVAKLYWNTRIAELQNLHGTGLSAAQTQAQVLSNAGGQTASLRGAGISGAASLGSSTIGALGGISRTKMAVLGQLGGDQINAQAGLALAPANILSNQLMNQQMIDAWSNQQKQDNLFDLAGAVAPTLLDWWKDRTKSPQPSGGTTTPGGGGSPIPSSVPGGSSDALRQFEDLLGK